MSDFLTRLALRQLGQIATIEPRVAPLYSSVTEAGNYSFADEAVDPPVEPAMVGERTLSQAPNRLPARANDGESLMQKPSTAEQAEADDFGRRIEANSIASKSQAERPGAFTAEPAAVSIQHYSSPQPSAVEIPQRLHPATIKSRPPARIPLGPVVSSAPVAPVPLVKPAQYNSARLPPSLTVLSALAGENRSREGRQPTDEAPVHVSIGRIEVTAVGAPAAPKREAAGRKPTMSLDDYLARRRGRDR